MRTRSSTAVPLEFALLLLLGVLWGTPYALTKLSLATIPPLTLVAARVSIAAAALWIVAIVLGRSIPRRWDFVGSLFVQGALGCVVPYTLIAFGQQTVDSALAAVLNSTTPLFVCLIGMIWTHHEPITAERLFGAAIGLAGVIAITGGGAVLGLGQGATGQAAIVLATLSSAASVVYGRRFVDIAPEVTAAGALSCAAIMLIPVVMAMEAPWHAAPSLLSISALLVNALIATALGFVIYFRLIRTIGSMSTASTSYLKPAVGVLIGCTFLAEPLTWPLGVGLLAILLGVAAINGKLAMSRLWTRIRFWKRSAAATCGLDPAAAQEPKPAPNFP